MTTDEIRAIFIKYGFTIKPGESDLKPYVFEAARALIAAQKERDARICENRFESAMDKTTAAMCAEAIRNQEES